MNLLSMFAYHLSYDYPVGRPCLAYPDKYTWTSLCHIKSGGDINRKLCAHVFGNADIIDMPLLNVFPGSTECNMEKYDVRIKTMPDAVRSSAFATVEEYNRKAESPLPMALFLEATKSFYALKCFHKYFEQTLYFAILARTMTLDVDGYNDYVMQEEKLKSLNGKK